VKKFVLLIGFLPLFTFSNINTQAIQPIIGTWKITKYFNAAEIGASQQVLQSKVGEIITFSSTGESFEGLDASACPYQDVTVITANVVQYFQKELQADANVLPLTPPITEIDACDSIFYDKNVDSYIIFESNGDFFEAVRVNRYLQ
jgi:hypothetical protein